MKRYRVFQPGEIIHTYSRAINSGIVFYSTEDCIFAITLYAVLSRRYNIVSLAFSIMPNHIHSTEKSTLRKEFILFHDLYESWFARVYNKQHNRRGALFQRQFGYAIKSRGKIVRDNLSYVANNCTVGNLTDDIMRYRWNLLAYKNNDHPFSKKIIIRNASNALKLSLKKLKYYRSEDVPLDYSRQEQLYKGLTSEEKNQLIDRILYDYNFLDYKELAHYYPNSSFENVINSFRLGSGSEHDIKDDWDDYSAYRKMNNVAKQLGYNLLHVNFEKGDHKELINELYSGGFTQKQVAKFLHKHP